MPLKINLSLCKKIGLPDYGSIGTSCGVEFEAESSLLQTDLEAFHRHVRNAYSACHQAVQDELARHQPGSATASGNEAIHGQAAPPSVMPDGNGRDSQAGGHWGAAMATV